MHYILSIRGSVSTTAQAEDMGIDLDNPHDLLDVSRDVDITDVSITGEVCVTAEVAISGVTVEAEDMPSFDADQRLGEAIDPYGSPQTEDVTFDIDEYPEGFYEVENVLGDRDQTFEVYAALARASLSVI